MSIIAQGGERRLNKGGKKGKKKESMPTKKKKGKG